MHRRETDDEFRARMEAKGARIRRFAELEKAATEALYAPTRTRPAAPRINEAVSVCKGCGKPRPIQYARNDRGAMCRSCSHKRPNPVRPCTSCGTPTRPKTHPATEAPDAVLRVRAGMCYRCTYAADKATR